ncbi:hypothetical protein CLIB1444_01S15192 [[Candida] jaroonii]|uniref:Uncharacterized protein n=1 Tax=[Candida] jaroonii TaxID=467808 RepID=A0ACA9Y1J0_9ASCO|nr:hypothetical protein CLIB1444_01S15192 [[Candida] jaroonii]
MLGPKSKFLGRPSSLYMAYGGSILLRNSYSTFASSRVNEIRNVLLDNTLSLQSKATKCKTIYEGIGETLLEETFCTKINSNDLVRSLVSKFQTSASIRTICYEDLIHLHKNGRYTTLSKILDELVKHGVIAGSPIINFNPSIGDKDKFANQIVMLMASCGDPVIASSYLISLHNEGLRIDSKIVKNLMKLLCLPSRRDAAAYTFSMLKIIDHFPDIEYSSSELFNMLSAALENDLTIFLPNLMFERLHRSITLHPCDEELSEILVKLITRNIENSHIETATTMIKNLRTFEHIVCDSELQVRILSRVDVNISKELIPIFVFDMSDLKVFNFLIVYYKGQKEMLQATLRHLKPPVERQTLSALFTVFVEEEKDTEAKEILQHILKSESGLNDKDFSTIIKKLLDKDKIIEVTSMIALKNIAITKSAYISTFRYLLKNDLLQENEDFLRGMVTEFKRINDDPILSEILPIVVNHLIYKVHPLVARSFLIKFFNKGNATDHGVFKLSRYNLPESLVDIMRATNSSNISSLYAVLDGSIEKEEFDSIKWCVQELRNHGHSLHEILSHIRSKNETFYSKIFKENLIKGV